MGNCFGSEEDVDDISLLRNEESSDDDELRYPPPYMPPYQSDQGEQSQTIYHLSPGQSRTANELTEEEKVRVAQREGLIDHLPRNTWDENHVANKKVRECCICMIDFEQDEPIRYLPCMHYYHLDCIDDWLMRSFTCPTCMEPVDAALLLSYDSQNLDSG
ncbi:RING finger protein 11-like isoform X2 [Clavelina lepadiformis]|uniref:RING finger protein 11-like isoform X2 n=1 Tax=Clavelina lepadiformis TaxID=159417 RepID=UPI00404338AE